jgi:hypothetical protein
MLIAFVGKHLLIFIFRIADAVHKTSLQAIHRRLPRAGGGDGASKPLLRCTRSGV